MAVDYADLPEDSSPDDSSATAPGLGGALTQALTAQNTTTAEAQGYARKILDRALSGKEEEGESSILDDMQKGATEARAALQQARERLLSRQIDPQEQAFARAQAWLAPTKTGHFGDTLSNVAGAYKDQYAQERELQQAKDQGLLGLDTQLANVDQNTLSAKLALQKLHEQGAMGLGKDALTVLGKSISNKAAPGTAPLSTYGKQASDEGLQPGTTEYQARVTQLIEADVNDKKARAGVDVTGDNSPQAKADLANTNGVPANVPDPWAGLSTRARLAAQSKEQATALKTFSAYPAQDSQYQAGLRALEEFQQLNKVTHTGPELGPLSVGGVHAGLHGVGADAGNGEGWNLNPISWFSGFKPNIQQMNKDAAMLTPLVIPDHGFGRVTNKDLGLFQSGMVGVDKSPQANNAIGLAIRVRLQNDLDSHEFYQNYFQTHQHMRGAEAAWNDYLKKNPIFDPNDPNQGKAGHYTLNPHRLRYDEYFRQKNGASTSPPDNEDPAEAGRTPAQIASDNLPAQARGGSIRMARGGSVDPLDFTNKYNTKLSPSQESQFQTWAKSLGGQGSSYDYDLRGAFLSGAGRANNGHFPDTYKKPNHPTFSDQSQYSGVDGYQGGQWQPGTNNSWSFIPSDSTLKMHNPQELSEYFKKIEPGSQLVLPPMDQDEQESFADGGEVGTGRNSLQDALAALRSGATFKLSPGQEDPNSPGENFGLETAGAGSTAAALALLARRVGAGRLLKNPTVQSALIGGGAGALAGGASSRDASPVADATTYGVTGALAGPLARFGVRGVTNAAGRAVDRATGNTVGPGAERMINAIQSDNPDWNSVAAGLRRDAALKVPSTIGDSVGPRTTGLATAALTKDTPAGAAYADQLTQRQQGANTRVTEKVNQALKPDPYLQKQQDLTDALYTNAKPLYEAAYQAYPTVKSPALYDIMNTPAGQEAAARAFTKMQNRQMPVGQPDATGMVQNPSLQYLDQVKRSFDDMITREEGTGPNYQATDDGRVLRGLRQKLVDGIDQATQGPNGQPGPWQQARQQYAGDLEVRDALRSGNEDFSRMTPSELAAKVGNMSYSEKDAFLSGVSENLFNRLGGMSGGQNPGERVAATPALKEKMTALFEKPGDAVNFLQSLDREAEVFNKSKSMLSTAGKAQSASAAPNSFANAARSRLMLPSTADEVSQISLASGKDAQDKIARLRAAADRLTSRSQLGNTLGNAAAAGAATAITPSDSSPDNSAPMQ